MEQFNPLIAAHAHRIIRSLLRFTQESRNNLTYAWLSEGLYPGANVVAPHIVKGAASVPQRTLRPKCSSNAPGALPTRHMLVATTCELSDDPLVDSLDTGETLVYHVPLEITFDRFRLCLFEHPSDWILGTSTDCRVQKVGSGEN